MIFMTDDGGFGVVITPSSGEGMFQFRLVLRSVPVGDCEPCILGSAMDQLGGICSVDLAGIDPLTIDPDFLIEALVRNDEIHDSVVLSLAESMDGWLICGFIYEDKLVMVAKGRNDASEEERVASCVVGVAEYNSVVEKVREYWISSGGGG